MDSHCFTDGNLLSSTIGISKSSHFAAAAPKQQDTQGYEAGMGRVPRSCDLCMSVLVCGGMRCLSLHCYCYKVVVPFVV